MPYKVFETFVGAGGSHIGFMKNGFKSIYINDNNNDCIKTLLHNNPKLKETAYVDNRSIIDIDEKELFNQLGYKKGEVDVFFGGIVCKGFSLAGERSPNDERNFFYNAQLKLVAEFKPKISIIENVPGIKNAKILIKETPSDIKKSIDNIWQSLEDFKGRGADLRKKNSITDEFVKKGKVLRNEKDELLSYLRENNFLIS